MLAVAEPPKHDPDSIHSLALLALGLVGQTPNGIQIGASVTVEFNGGGKPRRLASSSAKSSSLAVSSQQNSAYTLAPSKPTPGSVVWGGPILMEISTAGLLNLSWTRINHCMGLTLNLIGIHIKNLARPFNRNQKRDWRYFLWQRTWKDIICAKTLIYQSGRDSSSTASVLSRPECNAAHYVVSPNKGDAHIFATTKPPLPLSLFLSLHIKPQAEYMFTSLLWGLLTGILGDVGSIM